MFYQNVGGMRTKTNSFNLFMSSRDYDIIVIVETWLYDKISSMEYFDNYYDVYRHDRCCTNSHKERGGGVLIAVRANFKSEYISLKNTNIIEQLCIKILFTNHY